MFKLVLLGLAIGLLYLIIKRARQAPGPTPRQAHVMVCCATCGLHLPQEESIEREGRYYCCEAHASSTH